MQHALMVRRILSSSALALGLALVVAAGLLSAADAGEQIRPFTARLLTEDGTKRQAAISWSQEQFGPNERTDEVLLGRDDVFADALSSGGVQCAVDGPLLLSERDRLSDDVRAELARLGPTRITLFGGTAALSDEVERDLVDEGFDIRRLVGQTRIETAIEAARLAFPAAQSAILARAYGEETQAFADAIVAGAAACVQETPILLSETASLSASVRDFLLGSDIKTIYIAGGQAAIAESVVDELRALGIEVTRFGGSNRAATAVAITEGLIETGKLAGGAKLAGAGDVPCVVLVDGYEDDAWASGFAAARYVAVNGCGFVLTNGPELPPETLAYLQDAGPDADVGVVCGPFVDLPACEQAADVLGHSLATVVLTKASAEPGGTLEGTITGDFTSATVSGCGFPPGTPVQPDPDTGAFSITVPQGTDPGDDVLTVTVTYADGFTSVQEVQCTVTPAPSTGGGGVPPAAPALTLASDGGTAGEAFQALATLTSNGAAVGGTPVRLEVYVDEPQPQPAGAALQAAFGPVCTDEAATAANGTAALVCSTTEAGEATLVACLAADAPCASSDGGGNLTLTADPVATAVVTIAPGPLADLVVSPVDVVQPAFADVTLAAQLVDAFGNPVSLAGATVWFEVHSLADGWFFTENSSGRLTDGGGAATFVHTSDFATIDRVLACVLREEEAQPSPPPPGTPICDTSDPGTPTAREPGDHADVTFWDDLRAFFDGFGSVTATVTGPDGSPLAGVPLRFELYVTTFQNDEPVVRQEDQAHVDTDGNGQAEFAYASGDRIEDVFVCGIEAQDAPPAPIDDTFYCAVQGPNGMEPRSDRVSRRAGFIVE